MVEDYDGENDMDGFYDSPLPFNMSPDDAGNQGVNSELLRIIQKLENKIDSVDNKVESLFYQVITNNQMMMHQKSASLPNMPPHPDFPHPGFMPCPMRPPGTATQGPEEDRPKSSSFLDEGYASPNAQEANPAGEEGTQLEPQTVREPNLYPTGFNMLAQGVVAREQQLQQPAGGGLLLEQLHHAQQQC